MDLAAVLLLFALLLVVGLFVAAPLLGGRAPLTPRESPELSSLMAERDRVITALQELDFDFKLGKIPEQDYPVQRGNLLQKGAAILRRLDALTPAPPDGSGAIGDTEGRLEQIAAGPRPGAQPVGDDKIESMLAARRAARRAQSAGFCPRCGKPILTTDKFCPNCGKALT
jgi:hypothetical protein